MNKLFRENYTGKITDAYTVRIKVKGYFSINKTIRQPNESSAGNRTHVLMSDTPKLSLIRREKENILLTCHNNLAENHSQGRRRNCCSGKRTRSIRVKKGHFVMLTCVFLYKSCLMTDLYMSPAERLVVFDL